MITFKQALALSAAGGERFAKTLNFKPCAVQLDDGKWIDLNKKAATPAAKEEGEADVEKCEEITEGEVHAKLFSIAIKKIAERDKVSMMKAAETARLQHPAWFAAYQQHADLPVEKVEDTGAVAKARTDFLKCVTAIAARDKVSSMQAMEVARVEYPAEFDAYQSAA